MLLMVIDNNLFCRLYACSFILKRMRGLKWLSSFWVMYGYTLTISFGWRLIGLAVKLIFNQSITSIYHATFNFLFLLPIFSIACVLSLCCMWVVTDSVFMFINFFLIIECVCVWYIHFLKSDIHIFVMPSCWQLSGTLLDLVQLCSTLLFSSSLWQKIFSSFIWKWECPALVIY